ncbi:MAG: endolytic transglycosylase MltG [Cytophaga sp.]|nr:endolytic transglycosylase MltG [Cytophaga sp.]
MSKDVSKKKVAFFLVASILLISFSFYTYQMVYTPNILVDKESRVLMIKPGSTYADVQQLLIKGDFVNDMVSFSFLARLMKYDQRIHPGRYILQRNMSNLQAVRTLRAGLQAPVAVTFNNVRLLSELGEKITKNLSIKPDEFYTALDEFIAKNNEGFNQENILTMFIPNTYEVYYNVTAEDLVQRIHKEYLKFWNEERRAKAKELGLTPIEVSILASIVQAENTRGDEARTIAGLYINRLRQGMPLQADPTLVFASGDFSLKRVLNVHKENKSPYNTYIYTGLTPGPINMPEINAIDGVLNYEKNDYIFMCAKEDFSGRHNFAATLAEHNKNAHKYQEALTIEQEKGRAAKKNSK